MRGDLLGRLINMTQIGMPVAAPRGGADRDKHQIGGADVPGTGGAECQPAGPDIIRDQALQPRLIDRDLPLPQGLDPRGILVNTDDMRPKLGETRAGNQADIAGPDHGYLHQDYPAGKKEVGIIPENTPGTI